MKSKIISMSFALILSASLCMGSSAVVSDGINSSDLQNLTASIKGQEKIIEAKCWDGALIRVHYTDKILKAGGASDSFPAEVLSSAVNAYTIITGDKGFSSKGYSFVHPNTKYAYDPDRVIDVLVGHPDFNTYQYLGFIGRIFAEAPCFEVISRSDNAFDAFILIPSSYKDFIRNWEKMNPSPLGKRNILTDLKGTLIHEMLHTIVYYYNKNLGKDSLYRREFKQRNSKVRHADWYVEGLARYFETFVGARHDFFSNGFRQVLPNKIRFSRGGSNYFMRYPDQPFTNLRYENALFWKYLDGKYGMKAIETLTRDFRDDQDPQKQLEDATGKRFDVILKDFSKSMLFKEFSLKTDESYLTEVAKTKLALKNDGFYLVDGYGSQEFLGKSVKTDWVGRWGNILNSLSKTPIAGDNTPEADISLWASDFIEILPVGAVSSPEIRIAVNPDSGRLMAQCFVVLKDKRRLSVQRSIGASEGFSAILGLKNLLEGQKIELNQIDKVYLILTNIDPAKSSVYSLHLE